MPEQPYPASIVSRLRAMDSAISLTALAKILGMGRNTVYTMARAGRIPVYKLGSTLRADPIEIAKWMERHSNIS